MANVALIPLRVAVRGRAMFSCHLCEGWQLGDLVTAEFDSVPTQAELNAKVRSAAMPVGWASYLEGFRCPNCQ